MCNVLCTAFVDGIFPEFVKRSVFYFVLQSQGSDDHGHGEHKHEHGDTDLLTKFDGVWKGLTALAGIYLLFIIEHCIRMVKHYKDRGVRGYLRLFGDWSAGLGRGNSDALPSGQTMWVMRAEAE